MLKRLLVGAVVLTGILVTASAIVAVVWMFPYASAIAGGAIFFLLVSLMIGVGIYDGSGTGG